MKKHILEICKVKDAWVGGGVRWSVIFHKEKIDIDAKVMEWANLNNAFVYKVTYDEKTIPYNPPRYYQGGYPYPLGDGVYFCNIYYYDLKEVPDQFKGREECICSLNTILSVGCKCGGK